MPLYRPTTLLKWLEENGLKPKRGLSQNFLIDQHIVDKIINLMAIETESPILEIGPGPGVLTEKLLTHSDKLFAIEADHKLADLLPRLGKVHVYKEDALHFDYLRFFQTHQKSGWIMVSNLPYHLSTPLLHKLLPLGTYVKRLVVMVQREFADRLLAPFGGSHYGPLSILRELSSTLKGKFAVSRSCFFPAPHVDSQVLSLELRQINSLLWTQIEKGLQIAFAHKRKTLSKIIPEGDLFEEFSQKRAHEIKPLEWLKLAPLLSRNHLEF